MQNTATPSVAPIAHLGGVTFKVSRPEITEDGRELFILAKGRVEFLVALEGGKVTTSFNYNTTGPTMVRGRRVTIEFNGQSFYAV